MAQHTDLVAYQRERRKEDRQWDFFDLLKIGSNVYFESEKVPYVVKAKDSRFAILTKPFNLQETVLYCIIDIHKGIRGPNNLLFNIYDYSDQYDINCCLEELNSGVVEVSDILRRGKRLDIIRVENE